MASSMAFSGKRSATARKGATDMADPAPDGEQHDRRPQPKERPDLYEDDLTDERGPTPVQIEKASHAVVLDPD
jgi:hypothetical protein